MRLSASHRYRMGAILTQAGVTLGLAAKASTEFGTSFGPLLALTVTAEVLLNQLLGPILFKAAIVAVGEAHHELGHHECAPGQTPPRLDSASSAHPSPRSVLIVAERADTLATALVQRLRQRGWTIVLCDPELSVVLSVVGGGPQQPLPAGGAGASATASARTTASELDTALETRRSLLETSLSTPLLSSPQGGAAAVSGLEWGDRHGAQQERALDTALRTALGRLETLDVLAFLLPDDASNLALCRLLSSSAHLLPSIHRRQTSMPQLVVRVNIPTAEARYYTEEGLSEAFHVTTVTAHAALPNLIAEVLHPQFPRSYILDNTLPEPAELERDEW